MVGSGEPTYAMPGKGEEVMGYGDKEKCNTTLLTSLSHHLLTSARREPPPLETKPSRKSLMKAVAVYPGQANSVHLEDIPPPSLDQYPDGHGVLVKVLKVGVDAT